MTLNDQIHKFVERLAGEPVCDDCITERLDLSVRSQANAVTRGLGIDRGFERRLDACALCGATKKVIRHVAK